MNPRFIVFEGLDGVGKSTAARAFARSTGSVLLQTPPRALSVLREEVDREMAHAPEARQLFYAAAVVSASEKARRHISLGRSVVVDRYWFSTLAYGRAIRGSEMDLSVIESVLLRPTHTVWLEASRTERARRLGLRGHVTGGDHLSLDPATDSAVRREYGRLLETALAGEVVSVETDGCGPRDVLKRIQMALDGRGRELFRCA